MGLTAENIGIFHPINYPNMDKRISLTQDQLDFVAFMTSKLSNTKDQKRLTKCVHEINKAPKTGNRKDDFSSIRKRHNPIVTAEFLSLFNNPSGLKFLTHDFDPDSGITMADVVDNSKKILNEYNHRIPGSLYNLLNGFISGNEWISFVGKKYSIFLESDEMQSWIIRNPGLHPIISNEFGEVVQAFRNTVRLPKPRLSKIIYYLSLNKSIASLEICNSNLDRADFYTNVWILMNHIIRPILADIAQRDKNAKVNISYDRSTMADFRLCTIRIEHSGSEANSFEDVRSKLTHGGGALYRLFKSCCGYCDWSIEANFEGETKRWRILDSLGLPEIENLAPEEVNGFTHVLTFYRK